MEAQITKLKEIDKQTYIDRAHTPAVHVSVQEATDPNLFHADSVFS